MESLVRNEIFTPLVAGNLRAIIPDFTVELPGGDFSSSALLMTDGGKFRFEVHITNGEIPLGLLAGSRKILTRNDRIILRGQLGGIVAFEARDVLPSSHSTVRSRGTKTVILQSGRLHLPAEGTDLMSLDELRSLLKKEPIESNPEPKKGHAHVIFHGPTLRLRNGRSETRQTNDFLGEASSATLDTHTFGGTEYKGALIQIGQELHLHMRSLEDASFSAKDWNELVKRTERCVAFTHGFHPWPTYREVRFDHQVIERWISHHFHLDQTAFAPISKSMEFDLLDQPSTFLASILPTLEKGLRNLPSETQEGIEKLLWHFRSTEFSDLPHTTKLLMICTTLDGLMKLLAGAKSPEEKPKTNRVWEEGCQATGLSWERWGNGLFECFGRHRQHLAHGWLLLPKNDDHTSYFEDYSLLANGLNTLIAAMCSYEGPIASDLWSSKTVEIQSLKQA